MKITVYDMRTKQVVHDFTIDETRTSHVLPEGSAVGYKFEVETDESYPV